MDVLQIVTYIIVPSITILVIPAVRSMYVRLSNLETQIQTKISNLEARQLLSDKLDPVHTDLAEIKQQLNQIINRLLDNKPTK